MDAGAFNDGYIPFTILPSTSFMARATIYRLADEGGLFFSFFGTYFRLCDRQLSFYSVTRNENGKVSVETSGIDLFRSLFFFWFYIDSFHRRLLSIMGSGPPFFFSMYSARVNYFLGKM